MIYEFNCARCGEKQSVEYTFGGHPKYCSSCRSIAYRENKNIRGKNGEGISNYYSPLVDLRKCGRCCYSQGGGKTGTICMYFELTGHSRTFLHPEGLTADCKEYTVRSGGRQSLRKPIKLRKEPDGAPTEGKRTELDPDFVRLQKKIRGYKKWD